MTSKENSPDQELLARYRSASAAQGSAPTEAVRAAILAESRRVAAELAKVTPQQPLDVSRPAANDSRWKITAFGTVGAALLAALLFAPRYWESLPKTQVSNAPAAKTAALDAAAPAPAMAPAAAPPPKLESIAPSSPHDSLQEVVVARADRKASKPSAVQNYAASPPAQPSVADSLAPLAAPPSKDAPADSARASSMAAPASLQSAAGLGDVTRTALLLDRGVAVDTRDEGGRTPLMLAVAQGRLEVVRLLLQRGADPNAADNAGHTPLQQARLRNLKDITALLEGAGAR